MMEMVSLLVPFIAFLQIASAEHAAYKEQCEKVWQGYYSETEKSGKLCILSDRNKVHQISIQECNNYKTKYNAVIVMNDDIGRTTKFCEYKRPEFPGLTVRRILDEKEIIAESLRPAWQYCVETWKKNIGAKDDPMFKFRGVDLIDRENGKALKTPECHASEPELKEPECKRWGGTPWGPYCRFRNLERPEGSGIKVTYFQKLVTKSPLQRCRFALKNNDAVYEASPCPKEILNACMQLPTIQSIAAELSYLNKEQHEYKDYLQQLTAHEKKPSSMAIADKKLEIKNKSDSLKTQLTTQRLETKVIINQKDDYVTLCERKNLNKMGYPPETFDEAFAQGLVKLIQKPIRKSD